MSTSSSDSGKPSPNSFAAVVCDGLRGCCVSPQMTRTFRIRERSEFALGLGEKVFNSRLIHSHLGLFPAAHHGFTTRAGPSSLRRGVRAAEVLDTCRGLFRTAPATRLRFALTSRARPNLPPKAIGPVDVERERTIVWDCRPVKAFFYCLRRVEEQ